MKLKYENSDLIILERYVDGRPILIIDNLISTSEIERLYKLCQVAGYSFLSATSKNTANFSETMCRLSTEDVQALEFFPRLVVLLSGLPYDRGFKLAKLDDALLNCIRYGDFAFCHPDGQQAKTISILVYLNDEWDPDWGGETVFFNKNMEALIPVSVRPGRIVAFDSRIVHRAGVPNGRCKKFRYTLSLRGSVDS